MLPLLRDKTVEVLKAVLPLLSLVLLLEITLVRPSPLVLLQFLAAGVMLVAGMVLFLLGIQVGLLPMGEAVGAELPNRRSVWLIIGIVFVIGFATTIAEPDVIVLSGQVPGLTGGAMSGDVLAYVIGIGVGFFAVMAILRIIYGVPIKYLLGGAYLCVILLALFAPTQFVALAFDAGSVTTGALSAPIIIALGLGFSAVLAGRSAMADGFGLIGLASVGPVFGVLIMGIIAG